MEEITNGVTTYRSSPEEIEAFLADYYGDRIKPVDPIQLKKLHTMQQQQESWKLTMIARRNSSQNKVIEVNPQ